MSTAGARILLNTLGGGLLLEGSMKFGGQKALVSCGGVVIYRNKALILYYKNKHSSGWVLPKGKAESKESHKEAALREVMEETASNPRMLKPLGKTQYSFKASGLSINKTVHWFLMTADSFYCKPQAEEYFADAGFYKKHEAYHLLKYQDEKEILCRAFNEFNKLRRNDFK